ncbi:glycoside hydrolase family 108 protein [Roseomonas sp. BN140053]|uniref:glycoside hydrolase family 108 protein n=1 Tax=Roseomonas sp. BN140053 TaxID=3391898 RepID=UPI0039E89434
MSLSLAPLAASLLPELLQLMAGDATGRVAANAGQAVREVTGAEEPGAAQAAVAGDPALASRLRLRLTELALKEGRAQQDSGRAELEGLRARLQAPASFTATEMAHSANASAWGPALVSTLVVAAFFVTLVLLMALNRSFEAETAALVNVTIGTLGAAFAAVVNFWIGSSQSSRDKDRMSQAVQAAQSAQMQTAMTTLRDVAVPAPAAPAEAPPPAALFRAETPVAAARPAPLDAEARFDRCLAVVLEKEGGFVDDPRDPGGATNMGITLATLQGFREAPVTVGDVRDLTRSEAREIYRARYWTAMRCADLPAGLDLVVFDFGVNAGPSRSIKLLQRIAGVTADGSIGPITLAALRAQPAARLINAVSEARLEYYRALSTFPTFGRGWTARTDAVRTAALAMAGQDMPPG